MTTSFLRVSICVIFAASLASCVPMPHTAYLRPSVSGIIVEDSKPIPGVELFLGARPVDKEPCSEVREVVPVSLEGKFSWTSVQEYNLTDSVINPVALRGTVTVLCIRHPNKGVLVGVIMMIKQDKPVSLLLTCDVARPYFGPRGPNTTSIFRQSVHCVSGMAI